MKEFSTFHPFVLLSYFVSVISFTMFLTHPIFILISLLSSIVFVYKSHSFQFLKEKALFSILFIVGIVISNMIFVHKGATPLLYMSGNAITLEAIIYGAVFACTLTSVIYWFYCFNKIMSSDKIIYIFSFMLNSVGLILSMVLRYIPRFQKHLDDVIKVSNINNTNNSIFSKLKSGFNSFSILLTYSFENSIDTADSMKARGYGLKKRTSFNLFKFETRDIILLSIIILFSFIIILLYFILDLRFYYYPEIAQLNINLPSILAYLIYSLLLTLPLIIEFKEELKWKSLISKI